MTDKLVRFFQEQIDWHAWNVEICTCDYDYDSCWYRLSKGDQEQIRKDFLIKQLHKKLEEAHDRRTDASPEEGVE